MRRDLAGLSFRVSPEPALHPHERAFLAALPVSAPGTPVSFELRLDDGPLSNALASLPEPAPARIGTDHGRLQVRHRRFESELDWRGACGNLRRGDYAGALPIALRVALQACLPGHGGLPLHAAGIVAAGSGLAFFGISGAGKSTLAAAAPWPVLSDELVVVRADPWRLLPSGFWGAHESTAAQGAPLRALLALEQTSGFELERLSQRDALRRLLPTVLVPAEPSLWQLALPIAMRLVASVPVYRFGWSLPLPPWEALLEELPPLGPA